MIYLTGDFHCDFKKLKKLPDPQNTIVIGLGDVGLNYFQDSYESEDKEYVNNMLRRFYAVRGNHEMRPESCGIPLIYDTFVDNYVYCEDKYPNIRYFMDGFTYKINGKKTLVIGGAYSIDKEFRLKNNSKWFANEQLDWVEKEFILQEIERDKNYDMVLTHTCPISWQPLDLFINNIDQSKVDKSMELFLEEVKNKITFNKWYFGHFHADRCINDKAKMLFDSFEEI